ncbi:hypothetical protein [Clostridium fessum]|uniref:hypothetical protein n=1 Tax=Clostridium fessum TaxID=2126740 RepID=UPI00399BE960
MLVGQHVIFDYSFLKQWLVNHGQTFERNAVDIKAGEALLADRKGSGKLQYLFRDRRERAPRAPDDAMATGIVLRD